MNWELNRVIRDNLDIKVAGVKSSFTENEIDTREVVVSLFADKSLYFEQCMICGEVITNIRHNPTHKIYRKPHTEDICEFMKAHNDL